MKRYHDLRFLSHYNSGMTECSELFLDVVVVEVQGKLRLKLAAAKMFEIYHFEFSLFLMDFSTVLSSNIMTLLVHLLIT